MRTIKSALILASLALLFVATGSLAVSAPRAGGTWYVAPPPAGSDGNDCATTTTPCATINAALNKPGFVAGDTIRVAVGTYTGSGDQVVLLNKDATLSGGWNATFTTQTGMSTIDGEGVRRGVSTDFLYGGTSKVEHFTVQNGRPTTAYTMGGGILVGAGTLTIDQCVITNNNSGQFGGGGIYNGGTLVLTNSLVKGNTDEFSGGGIFNNSTLTITNSTIDSNVIGCNGCSGWTGGGGILNQGVLVLNNSTVSNNKLLGSLFGSGIANHGTLTLNNSTISGNRGYYGGAGTGIHSFGVAVILNNSTISDNSQYGIFLEIGNLALQNSILANNGNDCYIGSDPYTSRVINSLGYNIVKMNFNCQLAGNDLIAFDPGVGPLQDNGGPTFTHALPFESPAVNGGNPAGCMGSNGTLLADQRGFPRVGKCDIGAYENQNSFIVEKSVDKSVTFRGDSLTYQIILKNYGTARISNVSVTDPLPAHLSYINNSLTATSGSASYNNRVITWNGSIDVNTPVTIAFGTTVNPSAPIGGRIVNAASITGNGSVVTRTVVSGVQSIFASASKITDKSTISYGYPLSYTINFRMSDATPASTVRMTDTLPTYLSYIPNSLTATTGNPSYSMGTITWDGMASAGDNITITFGTMVNPSVPIGTSIVNSAVINGGGEIITRTAAVNFLSRFDSASKSISKSNLMSGEPVTYTITFKLSDVVGATATFVTDTLPNYLTYINNSLTATSGNPSYNNGTVLWNGVVSPGGTVTISFGATVNSAVPIGTTIVNSAVIDGGGEILTRAVSATVPLQTFLPMILKNQSLTGIAGVVTQNGSPVGGIPLLLRFYNGSSWSTLASAVTDANGYFCFTGVPSLGSGQQYYVRYSNSGTPGRLSSWSTRALTSYSAGNYVEIGNFDLADIGLTAPSPGATVALPYTFQWNTRSATPSDSYEFNLFDYNDGDPWWYTAPLGYVGSYTLTGLPSGFSPGVPYCWALGVYSPDGGYGTSYWCNVVRFSNTGSKPVPLAPAKPGRAFEDLPKQQFIHKRP